MLVRFNTKDAKVAGDLAKMEKKILNRFGKYFTQEPEDATVFSVKVTDGKKSQFKVELTLPYLGYQLRTEVVDNMSALAALDKGMDIMERQISKCKTKLARNKHQTPEPDFGALAFEEEPEEYEIVRVKGYDMKPMNVQEAILNMNLLGHNFYMFLNCDTNKVSTVYRRNDGFYGMIEAI